MLEKLLYEIACYITFGGLEAKIIITAFIITCFLIIGLGAKSLFF